LLPLHALPVGDFNQDYHCLLDLFAGGISYAPSCQLLQQVQKRERPNFESVFAIKNPTNDLAYTKLEVDNILNLFSSHQLLSDKQASKDALLAEMPKLKEANYLHFSCHGSFNVNSPQDSCLLLAESKDENNDLDLNKCLTLGNLFEQDFQLDNCRLVVLSACETGLVDSKNTSDEYIGLPSGFLYAGSTSVVSSLWQVNDLSTAFMIIKFLQNLQAAMINGEDFSVAVSLNQAQKWLRNLTKIQLDEWIGEHELNLNVTLRMELRRRFHNIPNDSRPFESPFYWAAFCGVGL
jgi:CHAT domain-containing protein